MGRFFISFFVLDSVNDAHQQFQVGGGCGIDNAGQDIRATQLGKIERPAPSCRGEQLLEVRQASGVPKTAEQGNRCTR
jgi:hypothetical protein